jgi:hypothetical protein
MDAFKPELVGYVRPEEIVDETALYELNIAIKCESTRLMMRVLHLIKEDACMFALDLKAPFLYSYSLTRNEDALK